MKDMVTNKYPWAEVSCEREDCLIYRSCLSQPPEVPNNYKSQLGKCLSRNICYQIVCVGCLRQGIRTKYVGETSGLKAQERKLLTS